MNVLLDYGCNPTRTGLSSYDLPLAIACCLGHMNIIELLLNYGANPSSTTILSTDILTYLSQEINKERYLKLIDLFKYRNSITSLSIVLTFDDLSMFHLLTGETINTQSISDSLSLTSSSSSSSPSPSSSVNITPTIDESNMKITEPDFDIYCEKLKIENYVENIILHNDREECLEQQQQNLNTNDNLSDYAEHGHFYSYCDTIDVESAVAHHDDGRQVRKSFINILI